MARICTATRSTTRCVGERAADGVGERPGEQPVGGPLELRRREQLAGGVLDAHARALARERPLVGEIPRRAAQRRAHDRRARRQSRRQEPGPAHAEPELRRADGKPQGDVARRPARARRSAVRTSPQEYRSDRHGWAARSGMVAVTRVPRPGLELIASSPPTAASRSRMLVKPTPARDAVRVEAGAVVAHLQAQRAVVGQLDHRDARALRVLGRVLQRLQAAEVRGALDLARVAPDAGGEHRGRKRRCAAPPRAAPRRARDRRAAPGRCRARATRTSSSASSTSSPSRRSTAAPSAPFAARRPSARRRARA